MISMAANQLRLAWSFIRTLVGDDAYDRYRAHLQACHADQPPLDRKAYYLLRQQEKWSGVSRCC
ncbi:MAG: YbdD/YjiX family protein [Steroidobacteraceae bacterium]